MKVYATTMARPSWRTRRTRPNVNELSCVEDKETKRTVDVALETGHRIDVSGEKK